MMIDFEQRYRYIWNPIRIVYGVHFIASACGEVGIVGDTAFVVFWATEICVDKKRINDKIQKVLFFMIYYNKVL